MKNSIQYLLLIFIILIMGSCKKILYGEGKTRVKGQVVDKFSGVPIPGAWVEILAKKDGSLYAPYIIDSIPTDSEGSFDYIFDAERNYNYYARGSYWESYASYTELEKDLKDGWANKKLELELHPLGWVKVNFVNVPPIDQASSIGINGVIGSSLSLPPTSKDTFLIGKKKCCVDFTLHTAIRKGTAETTNSFNLSVERFDTVMINVDY